MGLATKAVHKFSDHYISILPTKVSILLEPQFTKQLCSFSKQVYSIKRALKHHIWVTRMVNGRKVVRQPAPNTKNKTVRIYQCAACSEKISSSYEAALHPLLDCLICRKCYTNYGTGDFSHEFEDGVDDQGDDNYCRWCCDGGELFGCARDSGNGDRCHYSFCRECIQRNVPDDFVLRLESFSEAEKAEIRWLCYGCDKSKLAQLRKESEAAMKDLNERARNSRPLSPRPSQNKKRKLESKEDKPSRPALITVDPTPRNELPRFNRAGIKPRLDTYRILMENCLDEIRRNFNTATEMLMESPNGSPERRKLEVDLQIDALRKPINEFEMMLADLKKLNKAL